jgi:hypothetical protein
LLQGGRRYGVFMPVIFHYSNSFPSCMCGGLIEFFSQVHCAFLTIFHTLTQLSVIVNPLPP